MPGKNITFTKGNYLHLDATNLHALYLRDEVYNHGTFKEHHVDWLILTLLPYQVNNLTLIITTKGGVHIIISPNFSELLSLVIMKLKMKCCCFSVYLSTLIQ